MTSDRSVPPFRGDISFDAQHSAVDASFSFTCGHFGTRRGGFGLQMGKPDNQDPYIGVKDGDRFSDAPPKVLSFYDGAAALNRSDPFVSGVAKGSRYYPRIFTAALWLAPASSPDVHVAVGKRLPISEAAGAR
jgi:hypothetical protein